MLAAYIKINKPATYQTKLCVHYLKEGRRIPEGQSNSLIEKKLTTPWLKNKKANRQMIVQQTQHRKLTTKQHEPHQKLGWYQVLRKDKQVMLLMWHPVCCSCYLARSFFFKATNYTHVCSACHRNVICNLVYIHIYHLVDRSVHISIDPDTNVQLRKYKYE